MPYDPKLTELMAFFHWLTFLGISAKVKYQRDQTETGDETEGTPSVRCLQEGDDREVSCNGACAQTLWLAILGGAITAK